MHLTVFILLTTMVCPAFATPLRVKVTFPGHHVNACETISQLAKPGDWQPDGGNMMKEMNAVCRSLGETSIPDGNSLFIASCTQSEPNLMIEAEVGFSCFDLASFQFTKLTSEGYQCNSYARYNKPGDVAPAELIPEWTSQLTDTCADEHKALDPHSIGILSCMDVTATSIEARVTYGCK